MKLIHSFLFAGTLQYDTLCILVFCHDETPTDNDEGDFALPGPRPAACRYSFFFFQVNFSVSVLSPNLACCNVEELQESMSQLCVEKRSCCILGLQIGMQSIETV